MKTFISEIIPKLQRFSQKLDNLTLLTDQHWVIIDEIENSKNIYIFRTNNELLTSLNGRVEKGKWEYLGNNSLLIDKTNGSFLFKLGFFDEIVLALKVDGKDEYVFLINENKSSGELNSVQSIVNFLRTKYIEPNIYENIKKTSGIKIDQSKEVIKGKVLKKYTTDRGIIEVDQKSNYNSIEPNQKVFQNGKKAPDGKYKLGFMWYVHIYNGIVTKITLF